MSSTSARSRTKQISDEALYDFRRRAWQVVLVTVYLPSMLAALCLALWGVTKDVTVFGWLADGGQYLNDKYLDFMAVIIGVFVATAVVDVGGQLVTRAGRKNSAVSSVVARILSGAALLVMVFVGFVLLCLAAWMIRCPSQLWAAAYIIPTVALAFLLAARIGTLVVADRRRDYKNAAENLTRAAQQLADFGAAYPVRTGAAAATIATNLVGTSVIAFAVDAAVYGIEHAAVGSIGYLIFSAFGIVLAVPTRLITETTAGRLTRWTFRATALALGVYLAITLIASRDSSYGIANAANLVAVGLSASLPLTNKTPWRWILLSGLVRRLIGASLLRSTRVATRHLVAARTRYERQRPAIYRWHARARRTVIERLGSARNRTAAEPPHVQGQ
jgi:hypothetical protein